MALNSSAPISGLVAFLFSLSISLTIAAIGEAPESKNALLPDLSNKCKSVALAKPGITEIEFESLGRTIVLYEASEDTIAVPSVYRYFLSPGIT